ncbi:hypothetical protein [Acinetobacter cumulans]|uniref:hypothetical protein n=1 Tax=Acinetobacter cumulans TaxID=2136182 RepID=UPI001391EF1B|nr:hypothetical protein [Acinetobacter cumulans]
MIVLCGIQQALKANTGQEFSYLAMVFTESQYNPSIPLKFKPDWSISSSTCSQLSLK